MSIFEDIEDFDIDSLVSALTESQDEPMAPETISVPLDGETITVTKSSIAYPYAGEVLSLYEEKNQLLAAMEERRARVKQIDLDIVALKKSIEQKLQELSQERADIETSLFDERRKQRAIEGRIQVAQNQLRQALDNERKKEAFLKNALHFDEITAGLKWREFALDYQLDGAKLLATAKRAILGDKMGLGKTLTSLIACDMMQSQKILVIVPDDIVSNFVKEIDRWAPHRTCIMLGRQSKIARNMALDAMAFLDNYVVVINYSAWRKDSSLLDRLVLCRFDTVIMDEAHTIKETTTNAYKGCAKLVLSENSCPECRGYIQKVHLLDDVAFELESRRIYRPIRDYFICSGTVSPLVKPITSGEAIKAVQQQGCGWSEIRDLLQNVERDFGSKCSVQNVIPMTGTPILNKPSDLFSMLSLIDSKMFHSKDIFNRTYCVQDYAGKWIFKPGGLDRLVHELSGKYIARDRKTAGVKLPKQEVIVHSIEMDELLYPQQSKVIRDLSKHAVLILNGKTVPILYVIALITRKRQANVWPGGIEFKDEDGNVVYSVGDEVRESIKLDRICNASGEGLIPEITGYGDMTNGDRVVIFSQFKTPLAELEQRLNNVGISVVRFDGDTPSHVRDQVKIDFDRKYCDQPGYETKWQVVLCNYKTGGVGLNFTGATQMIILDEEWNAGKSDQAFNRIDRIGQTEETTVHILRLEKTIDEWMAKLIESKRDMVEGFENKADLQAELLKALQEGSA